MRNILLMFAIAGIFYLAGYAASSAKTAPADNVALPLTNALNFDTNFRDDEVPKITLADAKKEYDAGTAIIVDVRDEGSFKLEHIKGALHITTETLSADMNNLPKDKKIIAYCSCPSEHSSSVWVTAAIKKGVKNAFAMIGGTKAWKEAGFPMEKGE